MTITKSGELASFYTVNKAPIKHLKVYFSPKQAGEGDPSPSNVRAISGWQDLKVCQSGKNLVKLTEYTGQFFNVGNEVDLKKTTDRISVSENNNVISLSAPDYPWYGCVCATDILPAGNYTIHTELSDNNVRRSAYSTDQNLITTNRWPLVQDNVTITLTELSRIVVTFSLQESGTIGTITNLQVEAGNNYTTYEPYRGHTYNLDWSNDIGTIYGGYVDLITGELVQTHFLFTRAIADMNNSENYPGWKNCSDFNKIINYDIDTSGGIINNLIGNIGNELRYNTHGSGPTYPTVWLPRNTFGSEMTQTKWMTDYLDLIIQFVLPLATPIIHQLTSTQLQTFIGQNNIWSNADRVEVEYDLAESNDELYRRRNIILQGAPHLETVSGNIANFNTDLVAPMKDAKIYFEPIQEGEGDPSPENVRLITGWTGIELYKTKKNIINLGTQSFERYKKIELSSPIKAGVYKISAIITSTDINSNYSVIGFWDKVGGKQIACPGLYRNIRYSAGITLSTDCNVIYLYTSNSYANSANSEATWQDIQLELSSITTEYEPYNGQTISLNMPLMENLLDKTVITTGKTLNGTDGSVFNETGMAVTDYIPVKEGEIYKLSFTSAESARTRRIFGYDINKDPVSSLDSDSWVTIGTNCTLTATIPSGIKFIRACYFAADTNKILEGPDSYTLYGGYVDLINGKIVATYGIIDLGSLSWHAAFRYGEGLFMCYAGAFPRAAATNWIGLSDKYLCYNQTYQYLNRVTRGITRAYVGENGTGIAIKDEDITLDNLDTMKSALNGVHLVYQLHTPTEYPLTPQTLKTLKGVNNIWSNANGPISIQYWTH